MSKILEDGSILVQCEDCKKNFRLTSDDASSRLKHKQEYVVKGQSIFLTHYDCPECGRRHFVQIDDKHSLDELKEIQRQFVRLSALKTKGKEIPKKQSAKFRKAQKNLSDYRNGLMKQYTGTVLTSHKTGEEVVLYFSV